jgi:hypothetical protein
LYKGRAYIAMFEELCHKKISKAKGLAIAS